MKYRKNYSISNLVCPDCSCSFPIPRRKGSERERGHIKDLYCPFCKKETKMTEYKCNQPLRTLGGEIIF